ncbi:hypothetical protein TRFO_29483 [Tritrichomonas foetus]|uniref:Uncharacterized protein n=1 Tax=Tritrichomonas foetus TaxID=1144522 RepID=A0A1J4JW44_9EUKA|nr:hypothetical protein TRFO_29483 [Tritrichomonas foetus]|eukprot:OHT03227.1 hypothetical protein TRFO_29483 [Tritrichomonas foetus]
MSSVPSSSRVDDQAVLKFQALVKKCRNNQSGTKNISSAFNFYLKYFSKKQFPIKSIIILKNFIDILINDEDCIDILLEQQELFIVMIFEILENEKDFKFIENLSYFLLDLIKSNNKEFVGFVDKVLIQKELFNSLFDPKNMKTLFSTLFCQKNSFRATILKAMNKYNINYNESFKNFLNYSLELIENDDVSNYSMSFAFLGKIGISQKKKIDFFIRFFGLISDKSEYMKDFSFISDYYSSFTDLSNAIILEILKKNSTKIDSVKSILNMLSNIKKKDCISPKVLLEISKYLLDDEYQNTLCKIIFKITKFYENPDLILIKYFKNLMPFWKTNVKPDILYEIVYRIQNDYDQLCEIFLIDTNQDQLIEYLRKLNLSSIYMNEGNDNEDDEIMIDTINFTIHSQTKMTKKLLPILIKWSENGVDCEMFFKSLLKKKTLNYIIKPFLQFCEQKEPSANIFNYFSKFAVKHSLFVESFLHQSVLERFFLSLKTLQAVDFLASFVSICPNDEQIEWFVQNYFDDCILKKMKENQLTKLMFGLPQNYSEDCESDHKICIACLETKIFLKSLKNSQTYYVIENEEVHQKVQSILLKATTDIEELLNYVLIMSEKGYEKVTDFFQAILIKKKSIKKTLQPFVNLIAEKKGIINRVTFKCFTEYAAVQQSFVDLFVQNHNLRLFFNNFKMIEAVDFLAAVTKKTKDIQNIEWFIEKYFDKTILSTLDPKQLKLLACGMSQSSKEEPTQVYLESMKEKFTQHSDKDLMVLLLKNDNELECRIMNGDSNLRSRIHNIFSKCNENIEQSITRIMVWAEKGCEVLDFFEHFLTHENATKCVRPFVSFLMKNKSICNQTYHAYIKYLCNDSDFINTFLTERYMNIFMKYLNTSSSSDFLAAIAANGPFDIINKYVKRYFDQTILAKLDEDALLNFIFGLPHDSKELHYHIAVRGLFSTPSLEEIMNNQENSSSQKIQNYLYNQNIKDKKYIVQCENKKDRILTFDNTVTVKNAINIIVEKFKLEQPKPETKKLYNSDEYNSPEEEMKENPDEIIEIAGLSSVVDRNSIFNELFFPDNLLIVTVCSWKDLILCTTNYSD